MNCTECKELLVVHLEGLLEESQEQAVREHLGQCETCRAELAGLQTLQQRLVNNGKVLAQSDLENDVMNRIIREQNARLKEAEQASVGLRIRRLIMRSSITKLAIAAAVIIVAGLSIQFLGGGPAAYALEQTINANHSVRYLHIKDFDSQHPNDPKEFWIACNDQGQVENARYIMPAWDAPEDGAKSIVWSQGVVKVWFHKKNSLLICRDEKVQKWILDLVQNSDPRLAVERLTEQEKQGKLTLDIQQPADKSQPIIVTAMYISDGKSPSRQQVLHVDQATKLVTTIEYYHQEPDGQLVYIGRQENHDYNIPIASEMFALEDEVPADVVRVDQVTQEVGLPQGTMSDEQAAMEVARLFFEAVKAADYGKAGTLCAGAPATYIQERFGGMKIVRVASIGQPAPYPEPRVGGFIVPCEVEVQSEDGSGLATRHISLSIRRGDVQAQPDRWNIHGYDIK
jgi:hypothetical protein